MIWQTDAFALAASYDDSTGRYVGLWTPADPAAPPAASDSLLLVKPDIAEEQRAAEPGFTRPATDETTEPPGPVGPQAPVGSRGLVAPAAHASPLHPDDTEPTRFYGVKTLNADKIALDFKNIAEEVIAHLRTGTSTELVVRIEIEATDAKGFSEGKVRTISENARTLKFDQAGFEES